MATFKSIIRRALAFLGLALFAGHALGASATPSLAEFDLNGDGLISALDSYKLRSCYGQSSSCNPQADFDDDGRIGLNDYRMLISRYGEKIIAPSLIVDASVDLATGEIGSFFTFTVDVLSSTAPVDAFKWITDDGREYVGEVVQIDFSDAGLHQVVLRASARDGGAAEEAVGVVVFDPDALAPPELSLPAALGDVDGDGKVTLKDAHLVAKHSTSVELLSDDAARSAEIDFEEGITLSDARLIGLAVIDNALLPSALLPDEAFPGQVATIVTPELQSDGDTAFTVEVGSSRYIQEPLRVARGYASFLVPLDPTTPDSIKVQPGDVEVRLLKDGNVVQTFDLYIKEPLPLPEDPRGEVVELLTEIQSFLAVNTNAFDEELDALV